MTAHRVITAELPRVMSGVGGHPPGHVLITIFDDGVVEVAHRFHSFETWSPPLDLVEHPVAEGVAIVAAEPVEQIVETTPGSVVIVDRPDACPGSVACLDRFELCPQGCQAVYGQKGGDQ